MASDPTAAAFVEIIAAEPDEADALTEIAIAAKSHWSYPARWLEMWRDLLTITPEYIVAHSVHVARVDGLTAGFSGLEREGTNLLLQHLWVRPAYMGRRVGEALFHHAQRKAGALGFPHFEIEADPNAAGFYERMGAQLVRTNVSQIEDQTRSLPVFVCRSLPPLDRSSNGSLTGRATQRVGERFQD